MTVEWIGWQTHGEVLADVTGRRDDIDAVHVRYWGRGAWRAFSAPVPPMRGWLATEPRRLAVAAARLRRWSRGPLDLRHFDVVHVAPHKYASGLVPATRASGTPLSVFLDATTFQERGELQGVDARTVERHYRPVLRRERAVIEAADLITAMSRWAAKGLERDLGVDGTAIEVALPSIPPPIPRSVDRPSGTSPAEPLRIVFVGNDWERKGGPRLLRWHQERWADRAELHVVSRGARPVAGARNVVWHGLVPNRELVERLLPTMDLFVLPTHSDMSSYAAVEAAALGLPAVVSSIGGIAEVVADGVTGFVPGKDDEAGFVAAVEGLLSSPELRRQMGQAARARFDQHLNARVVGDRLVDRLVALSSGRPGRSGSRQ